MEDILIMGIGECHSNGVYNISMQGAENCVLLGQGELIEEETVCAGKKQ